MRKNKILILGASGFIGSMISNELKKNHLVFCQMRNLPMNQKPFEGTNLLITNVSELDSNNIIKNNCFDLVINLVSCDHNISEKNLVYSQNIKLNSINFMFDFYQNSSIKFVKFINFSTIHVYDTSEEILNEKSKLKPKNNYAINHLLGEKLTRYLAEKNKVHSYSLRLSNSFGYSHNQNSSSWQLVVNDLCRQAVFNSSMVIKSDGLVIRDFIYYKNVTKAIETIMALEDSGNYHEVLNLSSGKSITILEVAILIRKIENEQFSNDVQIYLNEKDQFECISEEQQKIIIEKKDSYTVDNTKIVQNGYREVYNLKEGLQNLLDEIRSKPV